MRLFRLAYLDHNDRDVEMDLGTSPRRELLSGRELAGRVGLEGRGAMIVADAHALTPT